MNAPLNLQRVPYRDVLPPEERRALLIVEGSRRHALLAVYAALNVVIFGGLLYTMTWAPLLAVSCLLLCYYLENVTFVIAHVGLHGVFMEAPESRMTTVTLHAFIHHYRDVRAYRKAWLESRLAYFFCPRRPLGTITTHLYVTLPLVSAGLVALVDWRVGLCVLSCMWGAHALQSVCHEWYHNDKQREDFYWAPTYWLLSALERVGIMSTARHIDHHRHHLRNLDEVDNWLDLYIPGGEALGEALWAWLVPQHVPGETRMVDRMLLFCRVYYPLQFAAVTGLFALVAWTLG